MTIGERIKKRRLEQGLTLLELGEKIGVREATIQRYESGSIKTLKQDTICKLADALQTTPSYLMGWENNVETPTSTSPIIEADEEMNPDIRMIARAGKKMTPEQAENLRKYAEFMFPEAFKNEIKRGGKK